MSQKACMTNPISSITSQLWFRNGDPIRTLGQRFRAYLHFNLVDHAFLRVVWTNFFEIAPGAYRSNQPSPRRLRQMHALGIRTVINLRGPNGSAAYMLEAQACKELGMTLIDLPMSARSMVRKELFLQLLDYFDQVEKPLVVHCKSGADRAGLASALYLMHVEGRSPEEASKMLGLKYVHLKSTKTGILDHFMRIYSAAHAKSGISIRDWLENEFDREEISASFKPLIGWA
ncbi:MAG: protein tyrosine/serine phosphatase [Halocynthiibacter sp.]|jgi:protein tyrosine/serine phosphatase